MFYEQGQYNLTAYEQAEFSEQFAAIEAAPMPAAQKNAMRQTLAQVISARRGNMGGAMVSIPAGVLPTGPQAGNIQRVPMPGDTNTADLTLRFIRAGDAVGDAKIALFGPALAEENYFSVLSDQVGLVRTFTLGSANIAATAQNAVFGLNDGTNTGSITISTVKGIPYTALLDRLRNGTAAIGAMKYLCLGLSDAVAGAIQSAGLEYFQQQVSGAITREQIDVASSLSEARQDKSILSLGGISAPLNPQTGLILGMPAGNYSFTLAFWFSYRNNF